MSFIARVIVAALLILGAGPAFAQDDQTDFPVPAEKLVLVARGGVADDDDTLLGDDIGARVPSPDPATRMLQIIAQGRAQW